MRNGFSMLMAIVIIVVISSIGAFVMNLSGKIVKETTTQYQREQSMLLAKSYTEYAIMAVTANDHNSSNCLNTINGTALGGHYTIRADITYMGRNFDSSCARVIADDVATPKSPLNIIVDVYVRYQDPDHPAGSSAPWITYHKRTLQKI